MPHQDEQQKNSFMWLEVNKTTLKQKYKQNYLGNEMYTKNTILETF